MIVRTGNRAPPPFERPTLTPASKLHYEAVFRAAKHYPIDVTGTLYSPGLGDLSGYGGTFQKAMARPRASFMSFLGAANRTPGILPLPITMGKPTGTLGRISAAVANAQPKYKPPSSGFSASMLTRRGPVAATGRMGAIARAVQAAQARPASVIRGLGDLAGATGITAVDNVIDTFSAKAAKLETAMKIVTPASAIAAIAGVLLFMGLGGRR